MNLENLKFIVSNHENLNNNEKEFLLSIYRDLFKDIYGYDIIGEVINNSEKFSNEKDGNISVIDSIKIDDNLGLLLIYNENNNLIGAGRLKRLNNKVISVPDIAIGYGEKEEKWEIWKLALEFIEDYAKNKGFKKIYIEVPLSIPYLLHRANELGFKEDPEDIEINGTNKTYILNKELERVRNE